MTTPQVYVIAEVGVNHNGDLALARDLVCAAAEAKADFVKFQAFRTTCLVTSQAESAGYQARAGFARQRPMLERLELGHEALTELAALASSYGIGFLASHFDEPSLDFLVDELDLAWLKVPSGEITNLPLLLRAARTGKPLLLSTGMTTLEEIEEALDVVHHGRSRVDAPPDFETLRESREGRDFVSDVVLFQCTSEYPTPPAAAHVSALTTLRGHFDLPVGLSDHTVGVRAAAAAVALGATWIEKHLTLDRAMPGPDHAASATPEELALLVEEITRVREVLGSYRKGPTAEEAHTRVLVRKSLVAARPVARGELLTPDNVTTKRPGNGLSPRWFWSVIGRPADADYAADEPLGSELIR